MRSRMFTVVLSFLAVGGIAGSRCAAEPSADPRAALPNEGIDRVAVNSLGGAKPASTTHPELIKSMLHAIAKARPDPVLYDCIKDTRINLCKGDRILHTLYTTSFLFDFEGKQYNDRTRTLERVAGIIRCGLENRASADKKRYKQGEEVRITWTVRSFSEKNIALPAQITGQIRWATPDLKHKGGWEDSEDWVLSFSAKRVGTAILAPGETRQYSFAVPSHQFPKGKVRLLGPSPSQRPGKGAQPIPPPDDIMIDME